MTNRSTRVNQFSIVYTKCPNHITDSSPNPIGELNPAVDLAKQIIELHHQMSKALEKSNQHYKSTTDEHMRSKTFNVGDLVTLHLVKEQFPMGTYHKLQARKIGLLSHFTIHKLQCL